MRDDVMVYPARGKKNRIRTGHEQINVRLRKIVITTLA